MDGLMDGLMDAGFSNFLSLSPREPVGGVSGGARESGTRPVKPSVSSMSRLTCGFRRP